jgi:hypothetical protein
MVACIRTSSTYEKVKLAVEAHRCFYCEVQASSIYENVKLSRNWPWRPIGVFPVRYQHHLHKKSIAIPVIRPWRRIGVFPVR